jgi:lipoate-protein ligase A
MNAYFLDLVTWENSQALYHAAAHLGREALFILRPATAYVCLGFHQDAEQEIDLDFAAQHGIPVFRREVGGGAVYLDSGQLFYQLILRRDHPQVPASKAELYHKFLMPVVETYREFGVAAEYKPVNDIIANGRKISGNGAAEIEGMVVLVGNFILDFNYEMMSKVLRMPDEKFRDKVYKTLHENLSTFRRETGSVPSTADLGAALVRCYATLLGPLAWNTTVDDELEAKAAELLAQMNSTEWLFANDRRRPDTRQVKIREGVYVIQNMVKTPGGLIRATAVNRDGRLSDVHLSGDFFFYPAPRLADLERALEGVEVQSESIEATVQAFYRRYAVESPGVKLEHFVQVLAATA